MAAAEAAPEPQQTQAVPRRPALRAVHRLALLILGLYLLTALLGYALCPDDSPQANRQLPALTRRPPGSQAWALRYPQQPAAPAQGLLRYLCYGQPEAYRYQVLADSGALQWQGERVLLHYASGPPDTLALRAMLPPDVAQQDTAALRAAWSQRYLTQFRFWLGTDALGRDLLSRLLLGSRVSLGIGLLSVLLSLLLGVGVGLLAGYIGGWADWVLMGLASVLWAIPSLVLALALAYVLGRGVEQLLLTIGLCTWVELARVVRSQVRQLKVQTFVEAAQVLGIPRSRILWAHLLPELRSSILILATANLTTAILLEAGLSFLGMGIAPPEPSWGAMLQEGYPYLLLSRGQGMAVFPSLALIFLILCLNFVQDGLRARFAVSYPT